MCFVLKVFRELESLQKHQRHVTVIRHQLYVTCHVFFERQIVVHASSNLRFLFDDYWNHNWPGVVVIVLLKHCRVLHLLVDANFGSTFERELRAAIESGVVAVQVLNEPILIVSQNFTAANCRDGFDGVEDVDEGFWGRKKSYEV